MSITEGLGNLVTTHPAVILTVTQIVLIILK